MALSFSLQTDIFFDMEIFKMKIQDLLNFLSYKNGVFNL